METLIYLCCAFLVANLEAIPVEVIQRNIPVEIRYDQIIPDMVAREQVLVHSSRNLDAKVQLSEYELPQAPKHLPIQTESEAIVEEKVQLHSAPDSSSLKSIIQPEKQELSEAIPEKPIEAALPKLKDTQAAKPLINPNKKDNEVIQGKLAPKPVETLEQALAESQKIITHGLKNLKDSFQPSKGEFSPSSQQWEELEKQVNDYFSNEKQKLLIRQSLPVEGGSSSAPPAQQAQNNWIQNIVNGFNGIATNFIQGIQNLGGNNGGAVTPPSEQGDEGASQQPPNNQGFQGFVQFFNNGISNIISTISGTTNQGPTTSNTNLSDSGTASVPSGGIGFFGTIVNNVQNALGIQPIGQPPSGVQGDTGTASNQQQNGPVQVIQSVGNAISNFFTGGNNPPSNSQGDAGSAPAQPGNVNIIQNIQNAIQNSPLNPFRPQNGQNQNPAQTAIQGISNQVQQQLSPSPGVSSPVEPQPATPEDSKKPAIILVEVPLTQEVAQNENPANENEIVKKQLPLNPK